MKNLLSVLFLIAFPLAGMAQMEVVSEDDIYVDTTAVDSDYMAAYRNASLDSLIEVGDLFIDENDPVYKPGMTYGEYMKASEEHIMNKLKEQAAGLELPKFTRDFDADKVKFDEFVTKMFSNPRLRAETPAAALILLFSDRESGIPYGQGMFTFFPCYFQITLSSTVEIHLYKDLGGKDDRKFEFTSALLSAGIGDEVRKQYLASPDEYKARIDSVSSFLKRLDWLGDIYPEDTLRSREAQDSLVLKYVDDLNGMKTLIDQQFAVQTFLRSLMSELYKNKDITLENYFIPELCDKIRHKKMKLSVIKPDKKWKNWDPTAGCEFYGMGDNVFCVSLNNKTTDKQYTEVIGADEEGDENSEKMFYIKLDPSAQPLRISDFYSMKEYWDSQADEYKSDEEYPDDFMPDPPKE